jgi:hypothetical protein
VAKIDDLVDAYKRYVSLQWERNLAGLQKCWFLVYEPSLERRLRAQLGKFELVTTASGHGWLHLNLSDAFATWMAAEEYREGYFAAPADLDLALVNFRGAIGDQVRALLSNDRADENTVVAISGVASLFGFLNVSAVVDDVADAIKGRLLVFFPGEYAGNNYRFLDARDGWNYLSVPITAGKGG